MAFTWEYDALGNYYLKNSRTGKKYLRAADKGGITFDPDKINFFDDFLGDVLEDGWSGAKGSDAQGVVPTITSAIGGAVRLTASDDNTSAATGASILTHALNWKAANGGLVFEARLNLASVANVGIFVGWTDVLGTTTVEYPMTLSGTTWTTDATDAVGFVFDTDATNDYWHLMGVADGTDATPVYTTTGPAAGTYQTFRIETDSAGLSEFFINGQSMGTVAGSVTATVALTPAVVIGPRTTTAKTCDVDYIFCSMNRS